MADKMTDKKMPKNAEKYHCEICNFTCSKYSNYKQHLLTAKHKRLTNTDKKMPKNAANINTFICECGKEYKHRQSLHKHQLKCKIINDKEEEIVEKTEEPNYKELLITAMKEMTEMRKENTEMRKQMTDMIPLIGNNNNSNNTNNFNLQFFLNNDCKDALNLTDFINSLQVQLKDLEYTADNGHIKGITNIFHTALSNMEQTKRPLHCTDLKREVLYIKDNNEWLIDEDKEKIKNAVNIVENKNIGNQAKWLDAHPNLEDEKEMEKYIQMQDHSLGTGEDSEKNKIVKNILKEVTIQK
tara:strand:+ start:78 stop:971 length:894 start_codon:yes stop_codon:yes gene_type:complete